MKIQLLALAAHPDDVELSCAGTLMAHAAQGWTTGIVDFTQGELGTRGTPELRLQEAERARQLLGAQVRVNLGFADGFFANDREHQLQVIAQLRRFRPDVVLVNAPQDRHPDHARAAQLSVDACFLSGLKKIETRWEGQPQEAWRPKHLFHFIQSDYLAPDLLIDVSDVWERKVAAIQAFSSQFHTSPESSEGDQTFISTPEFMQFIEARARMWGQSVGVRFAEGLIKHQALGLRSLSALL
jgi:bacillithiol biosynthesis deacetylase BshB1